jgi:hypothetical protein
MNRVIIRKFDQRERTLRSPGYWPASARGMVFVSHEQFELTGAELQVRFR